MIKIVMEWSIDRKHQTERMHIRIAPRGCPSGSRPGPIGSPAARDRLGTDPSIAWGTGPRGRPCIPESTGVADLAAGIARGQSHDPATATGPDSARSSVLAPRARPATGCPPAATWCRPAACGSRAAATRAPAPAATPGTNPGAGFGKGRLAGSEPPVVPRPGRPGDRWTRTTCRTSTNRTIRRISGKTFAGADLRSSDSVQMF